jgi:CHRD domain
MEPKGRLRDYTGTSVSPGATSHIQATLTGYEEVPSVSTVASGEFRAQISKDDQTIEYELTYSGLQGTVQQSHIHVAQLSVNGSIVIWLCHTATPFLDPTGKAPSVLKVGPGLSHPATSSQGGNRGGPRRPPDERDGNWMGTHAVALPDGRRVPRRALPTGAGRARRRMFHAGRVEGAARQPFSAYRVSWRS